MRALIFDHGGVITLRKKANFKPVFPDYQMWEKASRSGIPEEELWQAVE